MNDVPPLAERLLRAKVNSHRCPQEDFLENTLSFPNSRLQREDFLEITLSFPNSRLQREDC